MIADKVTRFYPRLSDLPIRRSRAGLRTLTPDGQFVVGRDPSLAGFFQLAGLEGQGVTVSYAVGFLAAGLVIQKTPNGASAPFAPDRFR